MSSSPNKPLAECPASSSAATPENLHCSQTAHSQSAEHESGNFRRPLPARPAPSQRTIMLSWAAVAVMAAFIFWMSSNTGSQVNQGLGIISALKTALSAAADALFGPGTDVSPIGHFAEYFLLGCALENALRLHLGVGRAAALTAIGIASLYGITDEWHQWYVPGRSTDPADWAVDTIAAGIGAFAALRALKLHAHQHPQR